MKTKHLLIFGLLGLFSTMTFGQLNSYNEMAYVNRKVPEAVQAKTTATATFGKSVNERSFALSETVALRALEKANKKGKLDFEGVNVSRALGHAYYTNSKYDLAVKHYATYLAQANNTGLSKQEALEYAHALKSVGNMPESHLWMSIYNSLNGGSSKNIKMAVDANSNDINDVNDDLILKALSKNSDGILYPTGFDTNGNLIVTQASGDNKTGTQENLFSDIFTMEVESQKMSSVKTDFGDAFNHADAVMTKDGRNMYFSRNEVLSRRELRRTKKAKNNYVIYLAQLEDDVWVEKGPASFNFSDASNGHAVLSPDEDFLYFTSDTKEMGMGMSDIYRVRRYGPNSFGTPENLGPRINSAANEGFPMITDDFLFFSSQGHDNRGGSDILQSKITAEGYGEATNLGTVVNTKYDDFALTINQNTGKAYFASNRSGNDMIYSFDMKDLNSAKPELNMINADGVLVDANGKPLSDVAVSAVVEGIDPVSATTDDEGNFHMKLPANEDVKFEFTLGERASISEPVTPVKPELTKEAIAEVKEVFESVGPIYYVLNSHQITEYSQRKLDKLINAMKSNSAVKVHINSHADPRGSVEYNQRLSERRSLSVKNYLISHGISADRLTTAGFGESQPVNGCADGQGCTEREYLLNRRTEFILTFN